MINSAIRRFGNVGLLLVLAMAILFMTGCGLQEPSKTENLPKETSQQEVNKQDQITRIAIRNGTSWGGLAVMAGELLKDEGYVYENGYTIDVANTKPASKSLIIVRDDNDTAYREAVKIHDVLGIPVLVSNDRFDSYLKDFINEGSCCALVILFAGNDGENDFDFSFTNKYADIVSKYDYPPLMKGNYTVLQIEPYNQ